MFTFRLFLDSGAPTLYNKLARKNHATKALMGASIKNRKDDDFSWVKDKEYLDYREKYIVYIHENKQHLEVYANLDIINNPQLTWENQRYLESCGLKPLPVWHFGCEEKWLWRYLDKGYDYIGIGGVNPNPRSTWQPGLDRTFANILCDKDGYPKVKLHGFATTGLRQITRYPWYSTDSATWIKMAAMGNLRIPQRIRGQWEYLAPSHTVAVTPRNPARKIPDGHIDTLRPNLKSLFMQYIEEKGFVLGKSHVEWQGDKAIETVIEPGLVNSPVDRCFINALYFMGLTEQLPKWPWPFKLHNAKMDLLGDY